MGNLAGDILINYDIGRVTSIEIIEKKRNTIYKVRTSSGLYGLKIITFNNYYANVDFTVFDKSLREVECLYKQLLYQEDIYIFCKQEKIKINGVTIWDKLCIPIRTRDNDLLVNVNSHSYAFLMTWVSGEKIRNLSHDDLLKQGILLGIMHKNIHIENNNRIDYIKNLEKFSHNIFWGYTLGNYSEKTYQKAYMAIDKTKEYIEQMIREQPAYLTTIHGDFYSYNLLKVKEVFIPIDFEYSSYGFLYQDLASILNEHDDSGLLKKAFLNGYKSIMPAEIKPVYLRVFQIYLTLLYLAANYMQKDDFSRWDFNFYD